MSPSKPVALDKALMLLNEILADGARRSVGDIAEALGIPKTTAYRLTAAFTVRGLLVATERGHYAPGSSIIAQMGDGDAARVIARVSAPILRRLARRCRQVTHLGVFEAGMVTYLVKAVAGPAAHFTREGMQLEAYCSAVGKVLLAYLPRNDLDAYLSTGPFVKLTENTITDPTALEAHIDLVRERGFAIDDREVADDLKCIAVPISDQFGRVRAGLSISAVPKDLRDIGIAKRVELLVSVAEDIRFRMWGDKDDLPARLIQVRS